MRPGFDLLICDCDGVLIDSEVIACEVDAEMFTAAGFPLSVVEVRRRFVGMSQAGMRAVLEREAGRALPEDFDARLSARLAAAFEQELAALPDVRHAVLALGMPRCVASSSSPERLRHTPTRTGLYDLFAPHVFSASCRSSAVSRPPTCSCSPPPASASRPAAALVVEDSVAGVTAARDGRHDRDRLHRRRPLRRGHAGPAARGRRPPHRPQLARVSGDTRPSLDLFNQTLETELARLPS